MENFDDEVREKLKMRDEDSRALLGRFEQLLMSVTRHELRNAGEFLDDASFHLRIAPEAAVDVPLGLYELPRRTGDAHLYRLGHPLAEALIEQALRRSLPPAEIVFDYSSHEGRISALEPLVGARGTLAATAVTVSALDHIEDALILAGETDGGIVLEEEAVRRLLSLPAVVARNVADAASGGVENRLSVRRAEIERAIAARNSGFFQAEAEKLDGWAEDLKVGLERDIKELDRQIREAKREAAAAQTLEQKLAGQKQVKSLEAQRNQRRKSLFEAQDAIDRRRGELIVAMESKLTQSVAEQRLFTVQWSLK